MTLSEISSLENSRVTIVIPAYNCEESIEQTLKSVLTSGFKNIIVVNDGSTDATLSILSAYPIQIITQENRGVHQARMNGLDWVESEFVIFLDGDDFLYGQAAKLAAYLDTNEKFVGVAGGYLARGSKRSRKIRIDGNLVTRKDLLDAKSGLFPISVSMWRTSAVRDSQNLALPQLSEKYADDYELILRISNFGDIGIVPTIVASYSMVNGKSTKNLVAASISAVKIAHYYNSNGVIDNARTIFSPIKKNVIRRRLQLAYYNENLATLIFLIVKFPIQIVRIVIVKFLAVLR